MRSRYTTLSNASFGERVKLDGNEEGHRNAASVAL